MCFRSADCVLAWTTWGVQSLIERRNESGRISPTQKTTAILTSREFFPPVQYIFFFFFLLSTNVFTIDGKLLRTRDESEQNRSRFLLSNAKYNGSETARKIRCRVLSRESYGTRREAIWNNLCAVNAYRGTWMCNGSKLYYRCPLFRQNSRNCNVSKATIIPQLLRKYFWRISLTYIGIIARVKFKSP